MRWQQPLLLQYFSLSFTGSYLLVCWGWEEAPLPFAVPLSWKPSKSKSPSFLLHGGISKHDEIKQRMPVNFLTYDARRTDSVPSRTSEMKKPEE